MPALVGTATVINVSSGGVFNVGDVFQIHPVTQAKTFSGAGSFNTGPGLTVSSNLSSTNTLDIDGIDQGIIGSL
ncbi:spore germination protein [Bacillus sp. REN10]|uniref:spore germination protein n=1 Tax=Bacillus sp. REN10 TaxID=2782541 RepID=UPI00193BD744|nr:spore germination protein [Bacillus sp. REN10]